MQQACDAVWVVVDIKTDPSGELMAQKSGLRIALIGCGAIGRIVAEAVVEGNVPRAHLVALATRSHNDLAQRLSKRADCSLINTPSEILTTHPTIVLEAAAPAAVGDFVIPLLRAGIDVVVLSVAAFANQDLFQQTVQVALRSGARVLIPSGAIGGLEVLKAARAVGALEKVTLSTRKHPKGLKEAPYVRERQLLETDLVSEKIIFEGTAREAAVALPQNVNIAATVSLAGLGFDLTRVQVIADPKTSRTVHKLTASGAFGELQLSLANVPHPEQPRTSWLAAMSAVSALSGYATPLQIGV